MKKLKGISLGLLTLAPFVVIAFFIYYNFPTTPALIITLIILMTGVMLGYYVYGKNVHGFSDINIEITTNYPELEGNLLKVSPAEFCEKLEKHSGDLYITGTEEVYKDSTLVEGKYNKLTDELTLKYTGGIQNTFTGVAYISIGFQQFQIEDFDTLIVSKNRQKIKIEKSRNHIVVQNGQEETKYKISNQVPLYLFNFGETV